MSDGSFFQTVLEGIFSAGFLYAMLRVTTPIVLPSLGALVSDRAGVINIGLEGTMLASAFTGVVFSAYAVEWWGQSTGQAVGPWLGLGMGLLVSVLMALLLAFFHLRLKANLILSGIAINALGSAGTVAIMYELTGSQSDTAAGLASLRMPFIQLPDFLEKIPVVGFLFDVFDNQNLMTWVALISIFVVWYFLYRTPTGVHLRAVGENPEAAASVGIRVTRIRYLALGISGFLAGLGGIHLSMGYNNFFKSDMTSGRGFIALATPYLGGEHPIGTGLASLVFGFFEALSVRVASLDIPSQLPLMMSYLATVMALVIYALQTQLGARVRTLRAAEGEGFDAKYWGAIRKLSVVHMFLAVLAVIGIIIAVSMYAAPDGFAKDTKDATGTIIETRVEIVYPVANIISLASLVLILINLPFMLKVERIGHRVLYGALAALVTLWLYLGMLFMLFFETTELRDSSIVLGVVVGLLASVAGWLNMGGLYLMRYAKAHWHGYWGDLTLTGPTEPGVSKGPAQPPALTWIAAALGVAAAVLLVLSLLIGVKATDFWLESSPVLLIMALFGAGMALTLANVARWGWTMVAIVAGSGLFMIALVLIPALATGQDLTGLLLVVLAHMAVALGLLGYLFWRGWTARAGVAEGQPT